MAIKLTTNLDVRTALPIDTRFLLTKAQMLAMNEKLMPASYFAICSEDSKLYVFNKENTVDPTTGKFRVYESGGSGGTDTKYRIVSTETNKWQLQKSTDEITWEDADGLIDLSSTITAINNRIAAEESNRTSADAVLQAAIEAEATIRETKDTDLQNQIDALDVAEYTIVEDPAPASDFSAVYHLTKDDVNVGSPINIPKSQVIKSATIRQVTSEDDPAHTEGGIPVGDKCIDFEWSNGTHSYLNVKDIASTYTAGAGITISAENEISVNTDDNSIITVTDGNHLSIKGYDEATHGQMLVKDTEQGKGLTWINPVTDTEMQAAVARATEQATAAGQSATAAGNSAVAADTSAQTAQRINEQTMAWVNEKFWWGTLSEYNLLEEINEGTFYFVQLDS